MRLKIQQVKGACCFYLECEFIWGEHQGVEEDGRGLVKTLKPSLCAITES